MNVRYALPALAVAALAAGAVPASAQKIETCTLGVCASVTTETDGGGVSLAGPCLPEAIATLCTPDAAAGGGTVDPLKPHPHPWTAGCTWAGSPGSRVDFGGTLKPAPVAGVTVTGMRLWCTLTVNGVARSTVEGVAWAGGLDAHQIDVSTARGDRVAVCMRAIIKWSDATFDEVDSAGGDCSTVYG